MIVPAWLSAIGFANPWLLLGLAALPAIWWLVRAIPPAPRLQTFPAIRLLFDLTPQEETPARTPWWLLALRLLAAALIVLALAQPLANPADDLPGSGPLVVVVDDGWAAAPDWERVRAVWTATAEQAGRSGRPVLVLPTTTRDPATGPMPLGPMPAGEAAALAARWSPVPWPTDRQAAVAALTERWADLDDVPTRMGVVWLSDGTDSPGTDAAIGDLNRLAAGLTVHRPDGLPLTLRVAAQAGQPTARIARSEGGAERDVAVRLIAGDGRTLARAEGVIDRRETATDLPFTVPTALANEARSLRLVDADHAAAIALLDQGWRRQTVGIVAGDSDAAQPLLTETHYLTRALAGVASVRADTLPALLAEGAVSVILLPDQGGLSAAVETDLADWVDRGGLLLRFAGPLLAASEAGQPSATGGAPALVPTALRLGDRALSGALSWSEPAGLGPFPENSPFFGLSVPPDVRVERQVLARPGLDLADRTWAVLEDGTPLITADRRGAGRIVLVHTTADPRWSNLALSGLFIDILDRILAQAGRDGGLPDGDAALPPVAVLDGRGALVEPGPQVTAIAARTFLETVPGPRHPPGLYGPPDAPRALNLGDRVAAPAALTGLPDRARQTGYDGNREVPLAPWLLAAALILLLVDAAISLAMRGLLRRPGRRMGPATRPTASIVAVCCAGALILAVAGPAHAQPSGGSDDGLSLLDRANGLWLAHVLTGDPTVDGIAADGLEGLVTVLNARTAVEPDGAVGVDIETDDLAFYPLLYWPISDRQAPPSAEAVARIDRYMRNGGVILFDTRDQAAGGSAPLAGASPGVRHLRVLAGNLDIPPLVPIGPDHVMTKAFYLLDDFPGRYDGGTVWVATPEVTQNDGVSPVLLGAHDWAAAWAIGEGGQPALPINASNPHRQRELAYRFGINLVMYALTGNYKADQVHVPAILERLGQ